MSVRDDIRLICNEGNLLEVLAGTKNSDREDVAAVLVELHNAGEINLLHACTQSRLELIPKSHYYFLGQIFREVLPRIRCTTEEAITFCQPFFNQTGGQLFASALEGALQEWFSKSIEFVDEVLAFIRTNGDATYRITRSVLVAGSTHEGERFVNEALELSQVQNDNVRRGALSVLGQITSPNEPLINGVLDRLREVIGSSAPELEQIAALNAALELLDRSGETGRDELQRLVVDSCQNPGTMLRLAIYEGFYRYQSLFTDSMTDAAFELMGNTDCNDAAAISAIDDVLENWDNKDDRKRVFDLLVRVVGRDENPVSMDLLPNFSYGIANGGKGLLGWYVVSLLLTGNDKLSRAAAHLLPVHGTQHSLDVDLSIFSLTPPWVLFLVKKIIAYCHLNVQGTASLLLACLRSLAGQDTTAVEHLTFKYFLINYPHAIDFFKSATSSDDVAADSVTRLSREIDAYLEGLYKSGICAEFRPSEREILLQRYKQLGFWRDAHDLAEQQSVFIHSMRQITMLYGTALITRVSQSLDSKPVRQEIPLSSHEQKIYIPRMYAMDPVGLKYVFNQFKKDRPPS